MRGLHETGVNPGTTTFFIFHSNAYQMFYEKNDLIWPKVEWVPVSNSHDSNDLKNLIFFF